ncbi:hypothetical protein [Phenylobacterium sp.]|jgi:hypothetical protein|uniref:hypothetical protein n=1 Tax=Phenylobacterium sp. TaxID=1871053 RepID=UPI002F94B95A
MPRDPSWTPADAELLTGSLAWGSPAAQLAPTPSSSFYYENIAVFDGTLTPGETVDYVKVFLRADATYNILSTGSYQTRLTIFDASGYRLLFVDGDQAGQPDPQPWDSIVAFRPEATGYYYLAVSYELVSSPSGSYSLGVGEDIGGDGRNTAVSSTGTLLTAYRNVLRVSAPSPSENVFINGLAAQVDAGSLPLRSAIDQIIQRADATTTVATLSYEFFTGKVPSQLGYDYLVSPTGPNPNNLNSAYYQNFSLENRYINFAVNLGKLGEGNFQFNSEYGNLTLFEATRKAYAEIFGGTPSDGKVTSLLSATFFLNGLQMTRAEYFAYYGQDGLSGLGTKAAMVGWLLGEAAKADIGIYAKSSNAFLFDVADGASFAVDLVGVYGTQAWAYNGA